MSCFGFLEPDPVRRREARCLVAAGARHGTGVAVEDDGQPGPHDASVDVADVDVEPLCGRPATSRSGAQPAAATPMRSVNRRR